MSVQDNLLKKQQSVFYTSLSAFEKCRVLLKMRLNWPLGSSVLKCWGELLNVLNSRYSYEIIWFDLNVYLSLPKGYLSFIFFKQLCDFSLTCFWFGISVVGFCFFFFRQHYVTGLIY